MKTTTMTMRVLSTFQLMLALHLKCIYIGFEVVKRFRGSKYRIIGQHHLETTKI